MSAAGTWNVVMSTPMGDRPAALTLNEQGGALTGSMSNGADTTEISDGAIDGDKASWKAAVQQPFPLTLEFSVQVSGDAMSGTVKLGMFGDAPLKGTRA